MFAMKICNEIESVREVFRRSSTSALANALHVLHYLFWNKVITSFGYNIGGKNMIFCIISIDKYSLTMLLKKNTF